MLNNNINNNFLLDSNNTILLLDSSTSFNNIKSIIKNIKNIITFDYESHQLLTNKNIKHYISDDFTDKNHLIRLQKLSFFLTKWSEEPKIRNLIDYEGINLGKLFLIEFLDFIPTLLKKFLEIKIIFNKYPRNQFLVSTTLYPIITLFTNAVKQLSANTRTQIYDNQITHSYNIGNKTIPLTLSRSNYLKLKNVSEKILHYSLNNKLDNSKNILLIEFDPIKYKNFFLKAKEMSQNLVLFNRRRPVIWNYESFSIIKNSKCKIATFEGLSDKNLKSKINEQSTILKNQLNSIWKKDKILENFFSFDGNVFWEALKPSFKELANQRMLEAIKEIELSKKVLRSYNINSVIILSEAGYNEQIIMNIAKMNKIPVIILQHGIPFETSAAFERNNLLGFFPNFSDYVIVWGNSTQQYIVKSGIPISKIKTLGNPVYDDWFKKNNSKTKKPRKTVLLATAHPQKDFVYDLTVERNENYRRAIESICTIVLQSKNNLIIKLHPSLTDFNIEELTSKISHSIKVIKTGSIFPLIEKCDVLVTFDISTTILEAQILDKPTISISLKDYGFGESEIFKSKSCIKASVENFEVELNKVLHDELYKENLIKRGRKFVENYLVNKGNSSYRILKFLDEL